jgi:DNA-binding CsgD family transcriptional regulator
VNIDAQPIAGTPEAERDSPTRRVRDGVGHQLACQQGRDIPVDRDIPGGYGRPDLFADAVRLAAATGDLDTARTLAGQAAELAEPEIPHRQGTALYCGGLVDHDASRLLAAAERYGDAARPLQQAKALEAAAAEFVFTGDLRRARAAFTRAVDIYTALGAAADVGRLQAEFRARGIRRGPRARHRQADSGWASLTPTEITIVGLVEEGLSNPEIAARLVLSPRTVGPHVSHILKKLGVKSRTDIAREAVLRTIAPR